LPADYQGRVRSGMALARGPARCRVGTALLACWLRAAAGRGRSRAAAGVCLDAKAPPIGGGASVPPSVSAMLAEEGTHTFDASFKGTHKDLPWDDMTWNDYLGAGGFGKVFNVSFGQAQEHCPSGAPWALKVSKPGDPESREERWTDSEKAACLGHALAATVGGEAPPFLGATDVRIYEGREYTLMPQASTDLGAWISGESHKTDIKLFFHVFHQLLSAIVQMHEAGAVHCDMKPENVMLSWTQEGVPPACTSLTSTRRVPSKTRRGTSRVRGVTGRLIISGAGFAAPTRIYGQPA